MPHRTHTAAPHTPSIPSIMDTPPPPGTPERAEWEARLRNAREAGENGVLVEIRDDIRALNKVLLGSYNTPGLLERMRRLEARRKIIDGVIAVGFAALFGGKIVSWAEAAFRPEQPPAPQTAATGRP